MKLSVKIAIAVVVIIVITGASVGSYFLAIKIRQSRSSGGQQTPPQSNTPSPTPTPASGGSGAGSGTGGSSTSTGPSSTSTSTTTTTTPITTTTTTPITTTTTPNTTTTTPITTTTTTTTAPITTATTTTGHPPDGDDSLKKKKKRRVTFEVPSADEVLGKIDATLKTRLLTVITDETIRPGVSPAAVSPMPNLNPNAFAQLGGTDWEQLDDHCYAIPQNHGEDRRPDKDRLKIVTFNAEWLYTKYPVGSDCQWKGKEAKLVHLKRVAEVIEGLDADIINIAEVDSCKTLAMMLQLMSPTVALGYRPYVIPSMDVSLNPVGDFVRKDDKKVVPIAESTCLAKVTALSDRSKLKDVPQPLPSSLADVTKGNTKCAKHYLTRFAIANETGQVSKFVMAGVHLKKDFYSYARCFEREGQAALVRDAINEYKGSDEKIIILGDMNDMDNSVPSTNYKSISDTLSILKASDGKGLVNAATFIANQGDRYSSLIDDNILVLIDHILLSSDWTIQQANIKHDNISRKERISEHWPVQVTLSLNATGKKTPRAGPTSVANPAAQPSALPVDLSSAPPATASPSASPAQPKQPRDDQQLKADILKAIISGVIPTPPPKKSAKIFTYPKDSHVAEVGGKNWMKLGNVCSQKPTSPEDRRDPNKRRDQLKVVTFNAEWLFTKEDVGSDCLWKTGQEILKHLIEVAEVIEKLDADIININEVDSCKTLAMVLRLMKPEIAERYRPYVVDSYDTAQVEDFKVIDTSMAPPILSSKCDASKKEGLHVEGFPKTIKNTLKMCAKNFKVEFEVERNAQGDKTSFWEVQAQIIHDQVEPLVSNGEKVIILGDLNDMDNDFKDDKVDPNAKHAKYNHSISATLKILRIYPQCKLKNASKYITDGTKRYSAWYKGSKSLIDHILFTPSKGWSVSEVKIRHDLYDISESTRVSDHWPLELTLNLEKEN